MPDWPEAGAGEELMIFHKVEEALTALENPLSNPQVHREATQYLAALDDCEEAKGLVESLESNDFGVRWEAANLLAELGVKSVSAVLKALMDPGRVADAQMREGVVHMIHVMQDHDLKHKLEPLVECLKGPAADISTMWQAYRILQSIDTKACPD